MATQASILGCATFVLKTNINSRQKVASQSALVPSVLAMIAGTERQVQVERSFVRSDANRSQIVAIRVAIWSTFTPAMALITAGRRKKRKASTSAPFGMFESLIVV